MCSFRNSPKRAAFDLLHWEFCLAGFRSLFRGLWIPPDCYVPFCSLLDSLPPHYLFGPLKDAPKPMFVLVGVYTFSSSHPLFHTRAFFCPSEKLLRIVYLIGVHLILTLQPWSPFSVIGHFLWITWKKWKKNSVPQTKVKPICLIWVCQGS